MSVLSRRVLASLMLAVACQLSFAGIGYDTGSSHGSSTTTGKSWTDSSGYHRVEQTHGSSSSSSFHAGISNEGIASMATGLLSTVMKRSAQPQATRTPRTQTTVESISTDPASVKMDFDVNAKLTAVSAKKICVPTCRRNGGVWSKQWQAAGYAKKASCVCRVKLS